MCVCVCVCTRACEAYGEECEYVLGREYLALHQGLIEHGVHQVQVGNVVPLGFEQFANNQRPVRGGARLLCGRAQDRRAAQCVAALEAGTDEVLADELTRQVKQGLAADPAVYLVQR
mgnify:CR=1 FL=1